MLVLRQRVEASVSVTASCRDDGQLAIELDEPLQDRGCLTDRTPGVFGQHGILDQRLLPVRRRTVQPRGRIGLEPGQNRRLGAGLRENHVDFLAGDATQRKARLPPDDPGQSHSHSSRALRDLIEEPGNALDSAVADHGEIGSLDRAVDTLRTEAP